MRGQLTYLQNLGYTEPVPLSLPEASVAIAAMLKTGDSAAAQQAILAERTARQQAATAQEKARRQAEREGSAQPVGAALNEGSSDGLDLVIGGLASAACWIVSRFIALMAWGFSSLAVLLIWLPSQTGLLAALKGAVVVDAGRQKVIPWIGAQDWRSMATGCRVQAIAATRQVDALLVQASRQDRMLLFILRFATAATAAIICIVLVWVF